MREITDEVKKVIIGKDEVVDMVFAAILAQGHVLMEDVPGVGKTTLAVAFSKALGLETKRIQFTPDTVASDITGYTAFDRQAQGFTFHSGAAMTNILLADEPQARRNLPFWRSWRSGPAQLTAEHILCLSLLQ